MRAPIETLRRPEVWALSFFVAASEASTVRSAETALDPSSSIELWTGASLLLYILLFALANRIGSFQKHSKLAFALAVIGILGLCLRASAAESASAFYLAGEGSLVLSTALLGYMAIEQLIGVPLIWTIRSIIASSVISALLVPFYHESGFLLTAVSLTACAICLQFDEKPQSSESEDGRKSEEAPAVVFPKGLAAGFFLLAVCFGFLQTFLYQESEKTIETVVIITKLVASGAFGLIVTRTEDTGYALLAKTISTISIAALAVFLAYNRASIESMSLMATGYSLLEITYLLIMVNIASIANRSSIKIVSIFFIIDTLGYMAGTAMSGAAVDNEVATKIIATSLVILLSAAAIWLFNEKHVNAFLWSKEQKGNDPPTLSFEEKIGLLASECDLSPRETEVLGMYASGRSAAFIAEATFVSSNTVRSHIKHIYAKCNVHSRQELITKIEDFGE